MKAVKILSIITFALIFFAIPSIGQSGKTTLNTESFQEGGVIELNKRDWLYQPGDDLAWASSGFDDSAWQHLPETVINQPLLQAENWKGRAWFRLHLNIEESLVNRKLALAATQKGATEVYIDGIKFIDFGKISDTEIVEENPNKMPLPFVFESAGEHVIAVRFASEAYADMNNSTARWMANGGVYPGFSMVIRDAPDTYNLIDSYANTSSMRIGIFFIGTLLALALLHFLLYLFYRVERANLFYSIYAVSFAAFLTANNLIFFGHLTIYSTVITSLIASTSLAAFFVALMAFLHIAFDFRLGKIFWTLTTLWALTVILRIAFLNNIGSFAILNPVLVGLSFTFCFLQLVKALRERRSGAWILMSGVQILALGMFSTLVNQFQWLDLPQDVFVIGELGIVLGVPIAVSIFLARNFARTNRSLSVQLAQVETLSMQKIEQERQASELRAENERRAKELEEARQLQLSMLPKKLPNIANLEIAAYMKPATEVGGDYYDFHVGADGTLTVAVGDATGHGLKAGTVVAATKSLFNAFADETNIPDIFRQTNQALKKMNLRGLFMAMTMLKIKANRVRLSSAGMPSVLIFRRADYTVETLNLRALPFGGIAGFKYQQQEFDLSAGDCVVMMSDGFPEMFNHQNEMLGFEKAAQILPEMADDSPQEIINRFVEVSEVWANGRPQDDDVTFVIIKVT